MLERYDGISSPETTDGLTIADLCRLLAQFPGTTPLVLRHEDGGFFHLTHVALLSLRQNANAYPGFGPHDYPGPGQNADLMAVALSASPCVPGEGGNDDAILDWTFDRAEPPQPEYTGLGSGEGK